MFPQMSYSARIEMSETEIVSVMSIHYSDDLPYHISWSATIHQVRRAEGGTIEYVSCRTERSEKTYPSHIEAVEAGAGHFLRQADTVK